jgi:hypothetical protein
MRNSKQVALKTAVCTVNDTLSFLDVSDMKKVPKLGTKVYWKPAHTSHYLHSSPNGESFIVSSL